MNRPEASNLSSISKEVGAQSFRHWWLAWGVPSLAWLVQSYKCGEGHHSCVKSTVAEGQAPVSFPTRSTLSLHSSPLPISPSVA